MFFLGLFVCWSVCHQAKSQVVKKIISVSFFSTAVGLRQ